MRVPCNETFLRIDDEAQPRPSLPILAHQPHLMTPSHGLIVQASRTVAKIAVPPDRKEAIAIRRGLNPGQEARSKLTYSSSKLRYHYAWPGLFEAVFDAPFHDVVVPMLERFSVDGSL